MKSSNCIERNVILIPRTLTRHEVALRFVKNLAGHFLIASTPMLSEVDPETAVLLDCSKVEER